MDSFISDDHAVNRHLRGSGEEPVRQSRQGQAGILSWLSTTIEAQAARLVRM
jgi:hypothetical protein